MKIGVVPENRQDEGWPGYKAYDVTADCKSQTQFKMAERDAEGLMTFFLDMANLFVLFLLLFLSLC